MHKSHEERIRKLKGTPLAMIQYEGRNLQFLFAILRFRSHVLLKKKKTSICKLDL